MDCVATRRLHLPSGAGEGRIWITRYRVASSRSQDRGWPVQTMPRSGAHRGFDVRVATVKEAVVDTGVGRSVSLASRGCERKISLARVVVKDQVVLCCVLFEHAGSHRRRRLPDTAGRVCVQPLEFRSRRSGSVQQASARTGWRAIKGRCCGVSTVPTGPRLCRPRT